MKTSEIRDKILEKKTLYNQAVIRSEEACNKIRNALDSITEEDADKLFNKTGIEVRSFKSMDLDRMKSDALYLKECQNNLDQVINALHTYLEESLNV